MLTKRSVCCAVGIAALTSPFALAQQQPGKAGPAQAGQAPPSQTQQTLSAIAALEEEITTAIAEAERSVVAIARVRRVENQPIEFSLNQFGRLQTNEPPSPAAPEFIPNEYASGV